MGSSDQNGQDLDHPDRVAASDCWTVGGGSAGFAGTGIFVSLDIDMWKRFVKVTNEFVVGVVLSLVYVVGFGIVHVVKRLLLVVKWRASESYYEEKECLKLKNVEWESPY